MAARQIERLAEGGASACLGGAVAFALFAGITPVVAQSVAAAPAAVAAILAYWLSRRLLAGITPPAGKVADAAPLAELLLEDVVACAPDVPMPNVPVPDAPVPDAPVPDTPVPDTPVVVRLFDPATMPTSRQPLASGGRLADKLSSAAPPDASQELRAALDQLRRSIRRA